MKKFFLFAALAALTLPIMVSCNPNDPIHHKTAEEVFNYWTQPREDEVVPIDVDHMIGYWMLAYDAIVSFGYDLPPYSVDYEGQAMSQRQYWDLNASMIRTEYVIDTVYTYEAHFTLDWLTYRIPSLTTYAVKWTLTDGVLRFPSGVGAWTVNALENDRMVLSRISGEETYYRTYKRVQSLPSLPPTMVDRLVQNAWRVVADTLITSTSLLGAEDNEIINIEPNILPDNTILSFRLREGDSNHDDMIISEGSVANEKADYVCYLSSIIDKGNVNFDLPNDPPYRFPYNLSFRPSVTPGKGILIEETWDSNYHLTYRYYIEAVQ